VIELKIIFLFYENCYIDKYKLNDTGVNGCHKIIKKIITIYLFYVVDFMFL